MHRRFFTPLKTLLCRSRLFDRVGKRESGGGDLREIRSCHIIPIKFNGQARSVGIVRMLANAAADHGLMLSHETRTNRCECVPINSQVTRPHLPSAMSAMLTPYPFPGQKILSSRAP